jgi:hypothetical protein
VIPCVAVPAGDFNADTTAVHPDGTCVPNAPNASGAPLLDNPATDRRTSLALVVVELVPESHAVLTTFWKFPGPCWSTGDAVCTPLYWRPQVIESRVTVPSVHVDT